MNRILLALILQSFAAKIYSQSFTVHDLIMLSAQPEKNINHFIYKNYFVVSGDNNAGDSIISYIQKNKHNKIDTSTSRSVDLYKRLNSNYFFLHTSSLSDYLEGEQSLIKSGFIYDTKKDIRKDSSILFQKTNISIELTKEVKDSMMQYNFSLEERNVPDSIQYAEDLLRFDSHEFLVSYFGKKNVTEDLYYLSEKELKKCSVLFAGTKYQAVFVWGDEINLNKLSYVLVSNVIPTKGAERHGIPDGNNEWKFHSGIYWGMPLRDMLRLNEMDFSIYGNKSELAFMVKPENTGKIDFKKTAIMFSCNDCSVNEIFDQGEVSALDIAKAKLPMRIFDIIIYP